MYFPSNSIIWVTIFLSVECDVETMNYKIALFQCPGGSQLSADERQIDTIGSHLEYLFIYIHIP